MSESSIGAAAIEITVDTSQFTSAIDAAKRAVSDMSTSAQQQYQQLAGAEKRRVDALVRQADTLGMTKAQQLAYNASLRTSGPILDEIVKKLASGEAAAKKAGAELNKYGVSAAQQAAALRGTPAQITDIIVSLQGGQRPMTVLLQQGGQLKDMFGGIVPAAQALGAQLAAMINPATIAAGALALTGMALLKGSQESVEFAKALAESGNAAGTTRDQLLAMAEAMDSGVTTQRRATEALAAAARSGNIAGASLQSVAQAALAMERMTGDAIDKTVAKFEEIGRSPVDALAKLNQEHHFLTAAVFEQVRALDEQGNRQEAARVATEAFSSTVVSRSREVEESVGTLEKAWRALKLGADGAWDAMLGVGRDTSSMAKFNELHAKLLEIESPSNWASYAHLGPKGSDARQQAAADIRAQMAAIQDESIRAAKAAEVTRITQQANDAAILQSQELAQYRTQQEKKAAEIARINGEARAAILNAEKIGDRELAERLAKNRDALIKGVDAKYAEKPKREAIHADPARALAERIKQQIALNTEQLQAEAKLTTSQRLRVQVEQELLNLGAKASPERREAINQLLKQLDATGELVDAKEKEARATEQLQRLQAQIRVSEENRLRANTIDLLSYGRGGDAVEMLRRQLDIQREYEEGLKQIRDRGVAADSEEWRRQEQELRASRERMLDAEREFQQRRLALMGDWRVGANAALEDYLASVADVASQSRDMFASTFGGAEDAIVRFVKTGKASVSDLADSIIADLARIAVRQGITGPLASALAGLFGGTTATGNALVSGGTQSITAGLMGQLIPNAKGGAYNSPSLSAYSGGVYDSPHLFAFAKGAGVFGEAGPEAIMPLRRGPDGRLGVSATGGGKVQVIVNNHAPAKVTTREQQGTGPNGEMVPQFIIDVVSDDLANGGKTAQAGKSRYGWRDQLGG